MIVLSNLEIIQGEICKSDPVLYFIDLDLAAAHNLQDVPPCIV